MPRNVWRYKRLKVKKKKEKEILRDSAAFSHLSQKDLSKSKVSVSFSYYSPPLHRFDIFLPSSISVLDPCSAVLRNSLNLFQPRKKSTINILDNHHHH